MRIVIGEDAVLLRAGVAGLLERNGFQVVAQAGDADDLLRKVRDKPDLALTDIRTPPMTTGSGRRWRSVRSCPNWKTVVLSQYVDEGYAMQLLGGGAERLGYLLKDRVVDVDQFIDALRRVAGGGSAVDPEVIAHLLQRRGGDDPLKDLTARERDVSGRWPRA